MRALLILVLAACGGSMAAGSEPFPRLFRRGDANLDGLLDLSDAVAALEFLFLAGPEPGCIDAADLNDDGAVDLSDPISLLGGLFLGGPLPEAGCGADGTADALGCAALGPCELEALVSAYDILDTLAGAGVRGDDVNEWEARFEGAPAAEVELSNPHNALSDAAGNIYIADKEAHAIRRVSPDGRLTTAAGSGLPGDDGDEPGPAVERRLANPNGIWVRGDGTFYVLDLDNGKVRRVDPAGAMTTLFAVPGGIAVGRGLWVRDDERLAFVSSGTRIVRWTPDEGVITHAAGFRALGNIAVDGEGRLFATDRDSNRVYRIDDDGARIPIAGNGLAGGGGDGQPALLTGLQGVRGIWFHPLGGYLLATHEGSQVWYVDAAGTIHLFLDGRRNGPRAGDGEHFRTPGTKISEARAVTMDAAGNVLVTENDFGHVRVVRRR